YWLQYCASLAFAGMFENRGPHMVESDYTPLSALDIFVKDLGIVSRECASRKVPLHVSNIAHQLFLSGSAAGWGRIDDSAVVKVEELLSQRGHALKQIEDLYDLCLRKGVYLVLHGASGLSKDIIEECIKLGVRKFNVNTEVRRAYMDSLTNTQKDLVHVMQSAKEAMKAVVAEKMQLFGSAGKAH
ncbi:L-threonate dehydrogenase, partial [Sesamum angolense]